MAITKRIDDAQGGEPPAQAAEDGQQQVKHTKKKSPDFGSVEQRKRAEAENF